MYKYEQTSKVIVIGEYYYLTKNQRKAVEHSKYSREDNMYCTRSNAYKNVNKVFSSEIENKTEYKVKSATKRKVREIIRCTDNLDIDLLCFFTGSSQKQIELYVYLGKGNKILAARIKAYVSYFIEKIV